MKWLAGVLVLCLLAGGAVGLYGHFKIKGDPENLSRDYFAAWEAGSFGSMSKLVADPPPDFAVQHRAFSAAVQAQSVSLMPGPVARTGDTARTDFTTTRRLPPGKWEVKSTLQMKVVDRHWKVIWTPQVLAPGIANATSIKLEHIESSAPVPVASDGKPLGGASVQPYLQEAAEKYGPEIGEGGWALVQDGTKRLKEWGDTGGPKLKTSIDRRTQEAADAALDRKGAIVAVRPSTGEVLAVADELGGGGAFHGLYAPGSTFKIVTAAAGLSAGLDLGTTVDCPATTTIGQRTISNHDNVELGTTTLLNAFAHSCNTTFVTIGATTAKTEGMTAAARLFGFDGPFALDASRGGFPAPETEAELMEASIGQGRVQATPLNMAAVASAVASGIWRSPRLLAPEQYGPDTARIPEARELPGGIVSALRVMMRTVVTGGTAASKGLPPRTAGKTGTAEFAGGEHAWFIGYRDDLAFAVFLENGGSGGQNAAPMAARFLKAL